MNLTLPHEAVAIRGIVPGQNCDCDLKTICSHDVLMPLLSMEEEHQAFWHNVLRLEQMAKPRDGKTIPQCRTLLFRSLPTSWISKYGSCPPQEEFYGKFHCVKDGFPEAEYMHEKYGNVNAREISVSADMFGGDSEDALNRVFESCVFAELYSASCGIAFSQSVLENAALEIIQLLSGGKTSSSDKRNIISNFVKGEGASWHRSIIGASVDISRDDEVLSRETICVVEMCLLEHEKEIENKNSILQKLNGVKWHPEGGSLKQSAWKTWSARLYVVATLGLSVFVGVRNLGGRQRALENIFDCLQVLSFLWVGAFGLIKLSSEDQSVLKHTLEGIFVVKDAAAVAKQVGCKDIVELKLLLLESEKNEWLAPTETSFAASPGTGSIQLLGGLTVGQISARGHMVVADRLLSKKDLECDALGRWIASMDERSNPRSYRAEIGNKWFVDMADRLHSIHDVIY